MRILVCHTGFLGDLVLTTPLFAAIKAQYPDAEITALTNRFGEELFRLDPILSGIMVFEKRGAARGILGMLRLAAEIKKRRFDKAFILHRSPRTALLLWLSGIRERIGFSDAPFKLLYSKLVRRPEEGHAVTKNLSLLGVSLPSEPIPEVLYEAGAHLILQRADRVIDRDSLGELRLFAPPAEALSPQISDLVKNPKPYVVVAPGSVWATKRWPASKYRQLTEALLSQGLRVVVLGESRDRLVGGEVSDSLPVVNLVGKTSIPEVLAIVERAKFVFCNDSFLLHVSSAMKVASVAIFCATTPGFGFGPWRNNSVVVERSDLFCKPCRRHGSDICPTGTELCMSGVSVSHVLKGFKEICG